MPNEESCQIAARALTRRLLIGLTTPSLPRIMTHKRGHSSVVERLLPKHDVRGSSPLARSEDELKSAAEWALFCWKNLAIPTR